MAILRNVKVQTSGNKQAWDSTYTRWRKLTYALINFPKEEIPGEPAQSSKSIRRRTTRFSQSGKISAESVEVSELIVVACGNSCLRAVVNFYQFLIPLVLSYPLLMGLWMTHCKFRRSQTRIRVSESLAATNLTIGGIQMNCVLYLKR